MKKTISILMTAVLAFSLAACGQTEAPQSVAAGSDSTVSEPEAQTESGLHSADGQSQQHFVYNDNIYSECVLQTVDYEQNRRGFFCAKPGCTHKDDSCPAVLYYNNSDTFAVVNGIAVLDDNTVAAAVVIDDRQGYKIVLTHRDGSPKELLVDGSGSGHGAILEAWDDTYLYYGVYTPHEGSESEWVSYTEELFRVPIAGGESEKLYDLPPSYRKLGVQDGKRIVMTSDSSATITTERVVATDILTGETQELASWDDSGLLDEWKFCFDNGVLCYTNMIIGEENDTLAKPIQWRTLAGEKGEVLVQWPEDVKNSQLMDLDLEAVIGEELVLSVWGNWSLQDGPYRLAVNLKTGETRPLTLGCVNDLERRIEIRAQTEENLLVVFGTSGGTATRLDAEGLPIKEPMDTARWGLISKVDFMNNQPNYREIQRQ